MKTLDGMREIGAWADLVRYYVDKNGVVWSAGVGRGVRNCGAEKEFRETFSSRFRGELYATIKAESLP